ncbi:MAG: endonuclease/exonuclease/phosphatase family protein [Candidatus Obscuribacterales bacterium]
MFARNALRALAVVILLMMMTSAGASEASDSFLKVLTWNIQVGSDAGVFPNGWTKRKAALRALLPKQEGDVICLQEPTKEQLNFVAPLLPKHSFVGVGRDDGKEKGEFCPIFYDRTKLELVKSGTFWLSDTPDSSKNTWDLMYKRICTWAMLRAKAGGTEFCVFNTHFPLNPLARKKSADLVVKQIESICPSGTRIVVGDFNCEPGSDAWKCFENAGFHNAEALLTKQDSATKLSPTYHVGGKPTVCIDAVFLSRGISAKSHRLINQAVDGIYPSDHFGTLVMIRLDDHS